MDTLFQEQLEIFENKVASINFDFIKNLATFTESTVDSLYIEKQKMDSLSTMIKKFFTAIITSLKAFKLDIESELRRKIREKEINEKLKKLRDELTSLKRSNTETIKVQDFWTIRNTYLLYYEKMKKFAKRFPTVDYSSIDDIDRDLEDFQNIVKEAEEKISSITGELIEVKTVEMIKFVDSELNGRSKVIDSISDCMSLFDHMERDAVILETKTNMLKYDVIPKHVGAIRRIVNEISKWIHKHVASFIAKIVFVFA